jgi:hypothetical protein
MDVRATLEILTEDELDEVLIARAKAKRTMTPAMSTI